MFNSIRHTPYTQPNGSGGFNYIAGGFQNQFGIETQIVASICITGLLRIRLDNRWNIGIHDNGSSTKGTCHSRPGPAINFYIDMVCWNPSPLLILDPRLPF